MGYLRHFGELIVYQKSREVSCEVFGLSRGFPKEEAYALTDQVRRSSRSIGAQVAEAWGKRRYPKHFISKLTDADAEQLETQHWLLVAEDSGYVEERERLALNAKLKEVGRMLNGMIEKADKFCGPTTSDQLHDDLSDYVLTPAP